MNQDFVDLLRSFIAHEVRFLVVRALKAFGAPTDDVTELTALTFAEAWPGRVEQQLEDMSVPVIGREAFIRNKKATGRAKDLGDVEDLE